MVFSRRVCVWAAGLCILLFFHATSVSAQTWSEIFKQKKTQISYLGQQITALQIYIGYARKGYELVGNGINLVKDISNGEFSLHRNFFASLAAVSPAVKNSSQVAEIVALQLSIITTVNNWKSEGVNPDEWLYLSMVRANLMAACALDLEELLQVITSGKLEMKEDERFQRLNKLYLAVEDKYTFSRSFSTGLAALLRQRKADVRDSHDLEALYGITP